MFPYLVYLKKTVADVHMDDITNMICQIYQFFIQQ